MNIYSSFDEVEQKIMEQTPRIIYKFRDCNNVYHKKIITEREVWVAHPHSLNDTYDSRTTYNLIDKNIDWNIAKSTLKVTIRKSESHLSEEDFGTITNCMGREIFYYIGRLIMFSLFLAARYLLNCL